MEPFGFTRASIHRDHALITPDTHVTSPLVGWTNATAVIHISPEMGARFTQFTATLAANSVAGKPGDRTERFVFVQNGSIGLRLEKVHVLEAGGFAFLPCHLPHEISSDRGATLIVFEKQHQSLGDANPSVVIGNEVDVLSEPFMGDADAQLKTLLPIKDEFDMAVNVFTYQPGATLPQVEIHVMEHGLLMLQGAGVYRLNDRYYQVQSGDVIWMASYCPQWFVAMGKTPARYIYYKDIHRDRLVDKR